MKPVLSVLVLCFIIIAIHQTLASTNDRNKRFYDSWDASNDSNTDENNGIYRIYPNRHKGWKKEDPCANKPLWYLRYQARLGKLSPFYDCLSVYGV